MTVVALFWFLVFSTLAVFGVDITKKRRKDRR
jgi:hypothetical protein